MTTKTPACSAAQRVSPYNSPQHPQLIRSELEQKATQLALSAMEQARETQQSPSPEGPGGSLTIKVQALINEMFSLHQEGILDGEFLIAKGNQVLLDLRSSTVDEIAKVHAGDPQFMIGSVSKQFFAVALLKALYDKVAKGSSEAEKTEDVKKLLHLPLSHFLPENEPLWNGTMPDWVNTITLHQLLSHTSGLRDYGNECDEYNAEDASGQKFFETPHSTGDLLKIIAKYPLNFAPGTKYSYSNTGYRLIAEATSRITGISVSNYLQESLFDPLGLSSTYNPETGNAIQLRESNPHCSRLVPQGVYDPTGDQVHLQQPSHLEDMSCFQGSGSIISTASDLLKWNIALHQTTSVLPRPLYDLFITENLNGYGYGIVRSEVCGKLILWHNGLVSFYSTELLYFPDHELSIIQLSHISIKSPTIMKEADRLDEELKAQITDEVARGEKVTKMLEERFPDKRGTLRRQAAFAFV